MDASRLLPVALLALPALGQETESDGIYEIELLSCEGILEDLDCQGITMSDGRNSISAGTGSFIESESGGRTWRLGVDVRIVLNDAELMAESGTFEFSDTVELLYAEVAGEPVSMSDYDEERGIAVTGTAQSIALDNRDTTLRLRGQAVLLRGSSERERDGFEGCDLVYNWSDHSLKLGSSDCGGIRVRLAPIEERDAPDSPPAAP